MSSQTRVIRDMHQPDVCYKKELEQFWYVGIWIVRMFVDERGWRLFLDEELMKSVHPINVLKSCAQTLLSKAHNMSLTE